jgi:hypothetical protein
LTITASLETAGFFALIALTGGRDEETGAFGFRIVETLATEHGYLTAATPIVKCNSLTHKANAGITGARTPQTPAPGRRRQPQPGPVGRAWQRGKEEDEMADSVLVYGKNT